MINQQLLRQIPQNQPYVPRMGMTTGDLSYFTKPDSNIVAEKAILFLARETKKFTFISSLETLGVNQALLEMQDILGDNEIRKLLPHAMHKLASVSFLTDCDLLFISPDMLIEAESVFFPSMWDPTPKFNKTIDEAHAHVPGLNKKLGHSIQTFIEKLPADSSTVFFRTNLGINQSEERNQHPGRNLPRISDVDSCFVRVEEQALMKLSRSGYTAFGIKVRSIPIQEFCGHPDAARGLYKAVETMPDDMAAYKGLLEQKQNILDKIKSYISNE